MLSQGLIAQNTGDDAEKNYALAVQKQESAKANPGSAEAGIGRFEPELEQEQAAVSIAQENLRNATIVSPLDGVVLSRDVEAGILVAPNTTPIMTVGDLSEVYVKGKVDETDVGKVYPGQPGSPSPGGGLQRESKRCRCRARLQRRAAARTIFICTFRGFW